MRTFIALGILLFGAASLGTAQEITGTITGTVMDETGGVLPGVTVVVKHVETGRAWEVITTETGVYTASLLPIGAYEVSAEMTGFRKFLRTGLQLSVNDRLRVDVRLRAGDIAETVEVMAESPVVRTETSEVGTLINNTQVLAMPLNGRNIIQLVAMQPGVSTTLGSQLFVGLGNLTNVFVNGNRASQNNWMIDGADNNDVGSNLALINYVNVDSVGEVRILRSNYSAEFGRSGGGQINVVTKSGTNAFHGSAYEFYRDDKFDGVNFFATQDFDGDGDRDPAPLDYHNYGGTIGGPVLRNKLFFFFGQEFRNIDQVRGGGVALTRVPTQKQRNGDFSEFSTVITDPLTGQPFLNKQIPQNRIDPLARALLDRFPLPNADPAVLGGNRNFSASTPQGRDFREELVRIDYQFSPNHLIYGRFIHDTIPSEEPFGEIFGTNNAAFPGIANTKTDNPGRSFVGTWNWIVGPKLLNEVSYNYSRGAILSEISSPLSARDVAIPKVFSGAPGDNLLPGVSFGGGQNYGGWGFFGPYDNTYGSHRVKETLTYLMGSHTMKGGLLLSWEFKNENAAGGTNGTFTFPGTSSAAFRSTGDAFADFLLGRATTYSETNIDITSHLRFQMYEAFLQDDWKIRPNLTLNLGVRWSAILQPFDTNDVLTNFDPARFDPSRAFQISAANVRVPGTGDPLNGLIIAGQDSPYGRRVTETQWANFGPRAGFAWDPKGDGRTSVRGGYGRYFDRTLVGIALQNAFINPPFATQAIFDAAGGSGPTLQNPRGGAARNTEVNVLQLRAMSPDFKIPSTHQWSLGVQRELPYNFNVDVAYVGSAGRNLLRSYDINQTPPGTTSPTNAARPYRGWGDIELRVTNATSIYHSLQVAVQRRFTAGLQLNVNYTLSRAESDSSSDRNTTDRVQDVNNLAAERAITAYDRTHIFGANYVWSLPFFNDTSNKLMYNLLGGWQLSGASQFASGTPLTITMTTNTSNSFGLVTRRPDLVGDAEGPKTLEQWFNTTAFARPAANTFGNAPRSVVRGPWRHMTDLALFKNFLVSDRVGVQFRLEAFNAFNETNFTGVRTTLESADFGRLITAGEPRMIQFGLKLTF
ncbi:MAG TPA: TonB-dependent receptor [Vicinamibacterales bacterium]|nr:TonB-dependent receptor [Vicinamibacterales bacterium]